MTKTNNTRKSTSKTTTKRRAAAKSSQKAANRQEQELLHEVGVIVTFTFMVFLFLCNFGLVGPIGAFFKHIMFGLFGIMAYIFPMLLFFGVFFHWVNRFHPAVMRKLISGGTLFLLLCAMCEFFAGRIEQLKGFPVIDLYQNSVTYFNGGGVFGGLVAYGLYSLFALWGSILILIVGMIICLVLITERSFVNGVKRTGQAVVDKSRQSALDRKAYALEKNREREEAYYEQLRLKEEQLAGKEEKPAANESRNKKVRGVNFHTVFSGLNGKEEQKQPEPATEQSYQDFFEQEVREEQTAYSAPASESVPLKKPAATVNLETVSQDLPETDQLHELRPKGNFHTQERLGFTPLQAPKKPSPYYPEQTRAYEEAAAPAVHSEEPVRELTISSAKPQAQFVEAPKQDNRPIAKPKEGNGPDCTRPVTGDKPYLFPPISLLQKGKSVNSRDGQKHLEETARRLQECLRTFGVNVTITDISQGPAVTRYELQPEQGVKVSRIVNLSDDIKLNLAATDIRIEAPIPGKSAIGIEVPNKENAAVAFRELIESPEFRDFPSKIGFAVGKDIAGKIVVADIAKMPHMLIAGATGSGKSVCINTLIMSILYKAHPDEVKLIMIDPKVVELSSYNGIPHLLIPVVTDPKQAAGALQWGVSEMMARYEKFAEYNVRDMKGFNAKVEQMLERGEENVPRKLPQIVIIVDELADLMMVSPGEVEEAICRLAQLARAAGIHLIIATQRPSVDVITGLIKANMPSRVAFAVSSGVDSRTILDMNGAEKLLGKGDMLFYPQGYSKPVRVQGSFVSDQEVGAVVDYLKNQRIGNVYQEEIQAQISNLNAASGGAQGGAGAHKDDRDVLFADAGRFIIEKDKASIGMLQRVFKIGFNRAARIVDQLCEYGVVGEDEGTKPRKVLMSMEQFENLLEEI